MLSYGITDIQSKPSLMKTMLLGKIIDKRAHKSIGYFISSKYEKYLTELIAKIEKDEQLEKLKKIKTSTDWEFLESGVDDGI